MTHKENGQIIHEEPTGITLLKCVCGNDSFRVIETADYLVDLGMWEGNETIRLCTQCGRQVGCFNDLSGIAIDRKQLLCFREPHSSTTSAVSGQQQAPVPGHCDHECVCPTYRMHSAYGYPCSHNTEPMTTTVTEKCENDARSRPVQQAHLNEEKRSS
jgi:hypothetical protein